MALNVSLSSGFDGLETIGRVKLDLGHQSHRVSVRIAALSESLIHEARRPANVLGKPSLGRLPERNESGADDDNSRKLYGWRCRTSVGAPVR